MRRASRGRRDLPESCNEDAGTDAGLATEGFTTWELAELSCNEGLLFAVGGSAGGVRGWGADATGWRGEAMSRHAS
jgi:hypothetical protein